MTPAFLATESGNVPILSGAVDFLLAKAYAAYYKKPLSTVMTSPCERLARDLLP
jgi:hypothetical protein